MSGGSCQVSAIRVFASRAEAIAHKASIVFELINSGSAVFTQILHSFFAKSLRVPSTRCGLSQDAELGHYNGGSWFGGGGIGIRCCMIYFARKLGRFDGGSCYGGGCIGIRYCIIYLARKL